MYSENVAIVVKWLGLVRLLYHRLDFCGYPSTGLWSLQKGEQAHFLNSRKQWNLALITEKKIPLKERAVTLLLNRYRMLGNHKVQGAKFKYHKIDGFICFRLNHTLKIALLIKHILAKECRFYHYWMGFINHSQMSLWKSIHWMQIWWTTWEAQVELWESKASQSSGFVLTMWPSKSNA